jgi:murein DD-endopeptidase MepM/ murein hydrolase activator NlpD
VEAVAAGRRRAVPGRAHLGGRKNLFRGLPPIATLAGAAVLVAAAAGAVTVGQQADLASSHLTKLSTQASVLTGVSSISSSNASRKRERAVSRDSERQALQDAAAQKLQAAAEAQAKQRNTALKELAASAEKQANQIAKDAWQLPITPGVYHLTAGFGDVSGLWSHTHTGLDFAAPTGTPIHAVANGVISETGFSGAYGNRTIETLEDGTELWYCHQNAFGTNVGDSVTAGQVIGYVGSTGNVTGPHVHLEVRPGAGDPVDPYTALVVHGLHP